MNTVTLCRMACSDPVIRKTFGGVYASDSLPKKKSHFSSYIVNLDPSSLPGSHWIGIFLENKNAYYFDSFGVPPLNQNILCFLKRNSSNILYNKVCFQKISTKSCGKFCLYFIYKYVRQLKLIDLSFSNRKFNEEFIAEFIRQKFKSRACCAHKYAKKQMCIPWIKTNALRKHHHSRPAK